MKKLTFPILLSLFLLSISIAQTSTVTVLKLDGSINPATADYVHTGIIKAVENNSECLIIELNTPGGLLKSTRMIVTDILQSKIPVIVYVYPAGSRAASAGVFIVMSSNIAVMAPGTNIGAAHPVTLQGKMDSVMTEKVTNDAAAFIRSISAKRKRNIKWAENAVRKSVSITEKEAVEKNVINFIAVNLDELLKKINGRKVELITGYKILNTTDVKIDYIPMTFSQKTLSILSDPNIAYILFMLGLYGLLFELYNPGAIFPGVIGGISIILAFYSMHTLPINYAGVGLIVFAIILFILEIKIVSHGLLTIGGVISLIMGSLMLINQESTLEAITISWEIILLFVVLTILFFLFAIGFGVKAQRLKPKTGTEGLIGEIGEVVSDLNPTGQIKIHGEFWKAKTTEDKIKKGKSVVVQEVTNLVLIVKEFD